jgi:hypothetical protein
MNCPNCDSPTIAFAVPDDLKEHANDEPALALCTHCLSLHPATESDADPNPDFTEVSDAFPTGESATAMALVIGLLDSLALYRADIEALLEHVERTGTDPLLVLDRLAKDPELDPKVNLTRRRQQVAQLRS